MKPEGEQPTEAVLYGIKTCDSCRKALLWLKSHHRPHRFHDLRADGLEPSLLADWINALGWESLLNRKSTTWRELPVSDRENLDPQRAADLMLAHPSLIKRPVLAMNGRWIVGFSPERYSHLP
ncbi:MAG: Spx/MgsR family RNA polymerase-binding regulatory protein [Methylococcaceae bacterium]|jgi:arsenate reductase